ncbi:hypothetical protein M1N57_00310 [Dehalococcoidales bacterium]|nr:hypothetical protein [Dehalococcoidales bacterium]
MQWTYKKISAVKAGKELDALVAEEIFGRKTEQEIPCFSTDISAAWELAEKLTECFVVNLYSDSTSSRWICRLFDGQEEHRGCGTAPEAICKAALAAKVGYHMRKLNLL